MTFLDPVLNAPENINAHMQEECYGWYYFNVFMAVKFMTMLKFSVMQKELDKIERFAREVAEKSKIDQASANKLLSSVKVSNHRIQLF